MSTEIPSAADVRQKLAGLSLAQLDELSRVSGVPRPTLHKIRYGQTLNPGIETVRQFLGHVTPAAAPAAPSPTQSPAAPT